MSNSSQNSRLVDWETKAYENQTQWKKLYCIWKSFQRSQTDYVKTYIGLSLFGTKEGHDTPDLQHYYRNYDTVQIKVINNIFNQLEFDRNRVILAHTYLYLSLDHTVVCIFRQVKSNDEIIFIDPFGRVYTSWDHFMRTNDLPACNYIAPADGVYKTNGNLYKYSSPAKQLPSKLAKAGDVAATGFIVGAVSLGALAMAPVTACALGITGTVYSVGRSIGTLVDRSDHKQSIAPDNFEAIVSWLNIGTSAITGISAVGLANSVRIVEMSGKYSSLATTALKGLNYAALASNVFNFGAYLFYFQQRLRDGELSSKDILELCANVFLIYGAYSNVRQMHNYLTNLEVDAQPKSLTKTAKRKLRRLRAKMRLNGDTTTSNSNIMEVSKFDANLTQCVNALASVACQMLFQRCPSAYRIYCKCLEIVNTVIDFRHERLTMKVFISNITNLVIELYRILEKDIEVMKGTVLRFLRAYFGANVPPQLTHDVVGIIDNGTMVLNNVNEELPEVNNDDESNTLDNRAKYEIILDVVQQKVGNTTYLRANTVLLIKQFTAHLSNVTRHITSQVQKEYDDIVSFNSSCLGEEKAKAIFSKIGVNSKNDFAEITFEKMIQTLKSDSGPVVQSSNILNKLISQIRKIFTTVSGRNDVKKMSVQETCEILENLIRNFLEPFIENYSFAFEFYARNSSVFGKQYGRVMLLEALGIKDDRDIGAELNEDTIFDVALKKTNLSEVIRKFSPSTSATTSPVTNDETFSDDYKIKGLLSLCSSFCQKINPLLDRLLPDKNMKKVCHFVVHKFTVRFQCLENERSDFKNIAQKLQLNQSYLGQRNFARMCRILSDSNKREIFDQVMNEFQREETISSLIDEYFQEVSSIDDFNVEVWKNIVADDGMKIYTIEIERYASLDKYETMAAHLFNLPKYTISLVSKTNDLVILKSGEKYIMFQFAEKENIALIMQVDLLASKFKE